jgi:hypothetical protein
MQNYPVSRPQKSTVRVAEKTAKKKEQKSRQKQRNEKQ